VTCFWHCLRSMPSRGIVRRGRGGTASPTFFDRGDASPTPATFFGLKFVQKLVHCCNWLLTETQCKIILVQQKFFWRMSVRVCRPKLLKKSFSNSCFRRPPLFSGLHPWCGAGSMKRSSGPARLSVTSIDSSSGVRLVCCWARAPAADIDR